MSIKQYGDDYEITCDGCDETIEIVADCWRDMIDAIKEEGWRTYKENGSWKQSCPDCVREYMETIND